MQYQIIKETLFEVGEALIDLKERNKISFSIQGTQFKSESDLIAQDLIKKRISNFSSLPIVSEEDSSSWKNIHSEEYWLIDPIDGTASFCGGYKGYVTQLALMKNKSPIFSAIYAPEFKLYYHAFLGKGSFLNDRKIIKSKINFDKLRLIDNYSKPKGIANLIYRKLGCKEYIESGSLGLKISRIAEGYADIFLKDVKTKIWDTAPGDLLLRELGSSIINLKGKNINYGQIFIEDGFICTRQLEFSNQVLKEINE